MRTAIAFLALLALIVGAGRIAHAADYPPCDSPAGEKAPLCVDTRPPPPPPPPPKVETPAERTFSNGLSLTIVGPQVLAVGITLMAFTIPSVADACGSSCFKVEAARVGLAFGALATVTGALLLTAGIFHLVKAHRLLVAPTVNAHGGGLVAQLAF